jgi:hypothetical protein
MRLFTRNNADVCILKTGQVYIINNKKYILKTRMGTNGFKKWKMPSLVLIK